MGKKRLLCISCRNTLVSWGKTSSGKKRYYCQRCGTSRIFKKKETDFFFLFSEYVFWGVTYEHLSDLSGYSIQHLHAQFKDFFAQVPPDLYIFNQSPHSATFLLYDKLSLRNRFVL